MKTDQPMNDKLKANAILYVGEKIKAVDLPTFTETFEFFESKLKEKDEEIDVVKMTNEMLTHEVTKAKKEIEKCKDLANIQYKKWVERNEELQNKVKIHEGNAEHWRRQFEECNGYLITLQSQLQTSNAMAERLAKMVDYLNSFIRDFSVKESVNDILTEYQNFKK